MTNSNTTIAIQHKKGTVQYTKLMKEQLVVDEQVLLPYSL